jgi:hypothetical protein
MPGPLRPVGFGLPGSGIFHPRSIPGIDVPAGLSYDDTLAALNPTILIHADEASGATAVDTMVGNDGTIAGTVTYRVAGPAAGIPYGMSLTGASGTITLADSVDTNLGATFTIVAWIRKTTTSNGDFLFKGKGTAGGYGLTQSASLARLQDGLGSNMLRQTTSDSELTWELYAFVRNGTTGIFELNANDDTTVSAATVMTDNTGTLVIGGSATFEIAGLAIWDGTALTSAQIQTLWDARNNAAAAVAAFDPAPFAGLYQTDEPTDWIAAW